jgi:hypothetical protein
VSGKCFDCDRPLDEGDHSGCPINQDWTDPAFVLGAVLAQLEDLSPAEKRLVLINAQMAVALQSDARHSSSDGGFS